MAICIDQATPIAYGAQVAGDSSTKTTKQVEGFVGDIDISGKILSARGWAVSHNINDQIKLIKIKSVDLMLCEEDFQHVHRNLYDGEISGLFGSGWTG